jgi:hypothetical protein
MLQHLFFNVVYIQSIGSVINNLSGPSHLILASQSLFFYSVGAMILMLWSLSNAYNIKEQPLIILYTVLATIVILFTASFLFYIGNIQSIGFDIEISSGLFHITLLSSVLPVAPSNRLTKAEKAKTKTK